MAHTHSVEDRNVYYIEQLCTIGFCGALGIVQILLYHYKVLEIILTAKFHIWVLLSGIVLTALAVIRAAVLWVSAGQHNHEHTHSHDCGHDHSHEHEHAHGHDHGHDHEHSTDQGIIAAEHVHSHACDHLHDEQAHEHVHNHADCGHEHGWAPWRYVVLLLPILLFLMQMPWPAAEAEEEIVDEAGVMPLAFKDLEQAAATEQSRKYWDGKLVRVKGQYGPGRSDRNFSIFRMKMTCCAADAYPLNVTIVSPEALPAEKLQGHWVNVTGQISFAVPPGRDEYVTILKMRKLDDVKLTSPDSRPFLQ